jgi:hypothetical protein
MQFENRYHRAANRKGERFSDALTHSCVLSNSSSTCIKSASDHTVLDTRDTAWIAGSSPAKTI